MTAPNPNELAERYFEHIRARNLAGMLSLFADNASFDVPDGRSFAGESAIREWFTQLFTTPALTPRLVAKVIGPTAIAVEIENKLPDGSVRNTANFFHLDSAGRIEHLRVYRRG
jgi:hypothetical protein